MVKFGFLSPLARNNESQDGGQFVFLGYMIFFFNLTMVPYYWWILHYWHIIQHMYVVIGTIWVLLYMYENEHWTNMSLNIGIWESLENIWTLQRKRLMPFEDIKQGFENKHGTNSLGFKERSIWKAHSLSNFLGTTLKCVRNMHS